VVAPTVGRSNNNPAISSTLSRSAGSVLRKPRAVRNVKATGRVAVVGQTPHLLAGQLLSEMTPMIGVGVVITTGSLTAYLAT